jgi:hypothetical protein
VPTTVHIPPALLVSVQKRARALGISRNRLIVRALEREIRDAADWTPGFVDTLRQVEPETSRAARDLLRDIQRRRRSKPPLDL